MTARRHRTSVWTIVAPIALVAVAALAVLLVRDGLADIEADRAGDAVVAAEAGATTATGEQALEIDASVPQRYRIRRGDTLSEIAARYGLTTDWIVGLNPGLDPLALSPGDRIRLR
jgi:LysM repeat protein